MLDYRLKRLSHGDPTNSGRAASRSGQCRERLGIFRGEPAESDYRTMTISGRIGHSEVHTSTGPRESPFLSRNPHRSSCRFDIRLMSAPPRGNVHMATDIAEYRGARPTMGAERTLAFRSLDLRGC
jgi:hypothetical protein